MEQHRWSIKLKLDKYDAEVTLYHNKIYSEIKTQNYNHV